MSIKIVKTFPWLQATFPPQSATVQPSEISRTIYPVTEISPIGWAQAKHKIETVTVDINAEPTRKIVTASESRSNNVVLQAFSFLNAAGNAGSHKVVMTLRQDTTNVVTIGSIFVGQSETAARAGLISSTSFSERDRLRWFLPMYVPPNMDLVLDFSGWTAGDSPDTLSTWTITTPLGTRPIWIG